MRAVLRLLRPHRTYALAAGLAIALATLCQLALPLVVGRAIDDGIVPGDEDTLYRLAVALVGILALYGVASYAQEWLSGALGQRVVGELRARVFAHIQGLPPSYYDRASPGVLISRMTNDVSAFAMLFTLVLVALVGDALTIVGTLIAIYLLDWELALIATVMFPLVIVSAVVFRRLSAGRFTRTRVAVGELTAFLRETFDGVRAVRAFTQGERHRRRFVALNEANFEAEAAAALRSNLYTPLPAVLAAVTKAVLLIVGGALVIDGDVEIGVFVSFMAYLQNFFGPVAQLAGLWPSYLAGLAGLERVRELLDEPREAPDAPGAVALPDGPGAVRLEGVRFAYQDRAPVFASLDVALAPGETVALVGENGAGKTTLTKLLRREYDVDAGRVLIDGHDVRDVTRASLRERIGVCDENPFLFSGTVLDNIVAGVPGAGEDEARATLEALGVADLFARLPEGLGSQVGEGGERMSAGQRQVIALARVFMRDPRIVVLDEITSNVDPITEMRIAHGVERLLAGRTAILVAHHPALARIADRVLVLSGGRIVDAGPPADVAARSPDYAAMLAAWSAEPEAAA